MKLFKDRLFQQLKCSVECLRIRMNAECLSEILKPCISKEKEEAGERKVLLDLPSGEFFALCLCIIFAPWCHSTNSARTSRHCALSPSDGLQILFNSSYFTRYHSNRLFPNITKKCFSRIMEELLKTARAKNIFFLKIVLPSFSFSSPKVKVKCSACQIFKELKLFGSSRHSFIHSPLRIFSRKKNSVMIAFDCQRVFQSYLLTCNGDSFTLALTLNLSITFRFVSTLRLSSLRCAI